MGLWANTRLEADAASNCHTLWLDTLLDLLAGAKRKRDSLSPAGNVLEKSQLAIDHIKERDKYKPLIFHPSSQVVKLTRTAADTQAMIPMFHKLYHWKKKKFPDNVAAHLGSASGRLLDD